MRSIVSPAGIPGSAPPSRDLSSFRIALLLREINAHVNARVAAELSSSGLTMPQITAIRLIAHADCPTMSELGREMNATPSTMAGIVDRLEAAGIVKRHRDEEDHRIIRVTLSHKGSAKAKQAKEAMSSCFSKAFEAIGDKELAGIERGLDTILSSFYGDASADTAAAIATVLDTDKEE